MTWCKKMAEGKQGKSVRLVRFMDLRSSSACDPETSDDSGGRGPSLRATSESLPNLLMCFSKIKSFGLATNLASQPTTRRSLKKTGPERQHRFAIRFEKIADSL
jgi:hypothetical protein